MHVMVSTPQQLVSAPSLTLDNHPPNPNYTRFQRLRGAMEPNTNIILDELVQINHLFDEQDKRWSHCVTNLVRGLNKHSTVVDTPFYALEAMHTAMPMDSIDPSPIWRS